ncbi:MAG: hypothetical protein H6837_06420 [Planctomycetes bacterium]|nr:hypothetical protein [Planctomycetota bacterium]
MSALIGQGEGYARLRVAARLRRMHHGLLVTGPAGSGKSTAIDELAAAVLCADESDRSADAACGECPACRAGAAHPDLFRVEIPEDKDEIPVDSVRELRASLMRLPVFGRARVAVLDPADGLNLQGQNALLKTLEEPGRDTFLLLGTRRPEALLDTVRSRIAVLLMRTLPEEQVLARLAALEPEVEPADRRWAAGLAEGCVGQARAFLGEEIRPLYVALQDFLAGRGGTAIQVARAALLGVSGRIPTLHRARQVLWILRTLLRNALWKVLASADAAPYSAGASAACTLLETLLDAESDLAQRIPPEQVLVHVLLTVDPQDSTAIR